MRAGQIGVSALPFDNTPFLNRAQWHAMTCWLPEELRETLSPKSAVQNDVNGFPRAGTKDRHAVLPVSITSRWRYDNDPPFPPLADFATAWNRLGLQPRLRAANGTRLPLEFYLGAQSWGRPRNPTEFCREDVSGGQILDAGHNGQVDRSKRTLDLRLGLQMRQMRHAPVAHRWRLRQARSGS